MSETERQQASEVAVVRVEQAGPVGRNPVPWSRVPGFAVRVRYFLADGTVRENSSMASRKKDLLAELARLPGRPRQPLFARFNDAGELVGYIEEYAAHPERYEAGRRWLAACETFESARAKDIA
jgi:hypothetical protein